MPLGSSETVKPSQYATTSYTLAKQLNMVSNINIAENDGKYTLSFDPIENAATYEVRIVKLSDNGYHSHLAGRNLPNPFTTTQSTDITEYVSQQGEYYVYVTAKAPTNSFYSDANESKTFGVVSKLTTLNVPENVTFENKDKNTYLVKWTGDTNADYYLVRVTDPNKFVYEFNAYNTTTNINSYVTIQGEYSVDIYSKVDPTSESSKAHESSSAATASIDYSYIETWDFERYSVYMYGTKANFMVKTFEDLKTLKTFS